MDIDPSVPSANGSDDPWEEALNLETKFYTEGYQAGHEHGQLHGLYEGRELGQEKAWEIWEEVGYMEGFAMFWAGGVLGGDERKGRGKDARALSHVKQLLALIETFPTINPSSAVSATDPNTANGNSSNVMSVDSSSSSTPHNESSAPAETETDLILLLSSIRARYKLLCSALGVRPRLVAAAAPNAAAGGAEDGDVQVVVQAEGVVQGIEGPMKGVDTRMLRY